MKASPRSKVHIFVEFALQLLHDAIKARRMQRAAEMRNVDEDLSSRLRPFVPFMNECLKLKYEKVGRHIYYSL